MSGFADLVTRAQPRLADVNATATEGRTWLWTFTDLVDAAGDPIDLTTFAVGVCQVLTDVKGEVVLELDFTGGLGYFTVGAADADTAGLALGATATQPRQCVWFLSVRYGDDIVQFWGPRGSRFQIEGA